MPAWKLSLLIIPPQDPASLSQHIFIAPAAASLTRFFSCTSSVHVTSLALTDHCWIRPRYSLEHPVPPFDTSWHTHDTYVTSHHSNMCTDGGHTNQVVIFLPVPQVRTSLLVALSLTRLEVAIDTACVCVVNCCGIVPMATERHTKTAVERLDLINWEAGESLVELDL